MTRLIPHTDMSAEELVDCSYQALAICRLCEAAAWSIQNGETPHNLADAIGSGMRLARDLMAPVHDALERSEGLNSALGETGGAS